MTGEELFALLLILAVAMIAATTIYLIFRGRS
jgi:hypothetical protein